MVKPLRKLYGGIYFKGQVPLIRPGKYVVQIKHARFNGMTNTVRTEITIIKRLKPAGRGQHAPRLQSVRTPGWSSRKRHDVVRAGP